MQAKVKNSCKMQTITACGGLEYIKGEWRPVPEYEEANALTNPMLDTREGEKEPRQRHKPAEQPETEAPAAEPEQPETEEVTAEKIPKAPVKRRRAVTK